MKKKILSLLCLVMVWALPSALQAEMKPSVTVYGNLRYSFNYVDDEWSGIERWKGTDNVSRFGIKGSYGNEKGKAFVHLQVGAPSDENKDGHGFTRRFFFGGFECDYGKLTYGRMTNAYKFPGYALDPFYDLSRINSGGVFAGGGASYGLSPATNGFTDNSLQYVTPDLSGFKLLGGIAFDDSNDDNELAYLAGGSYTTGGFTLGGVYADNPTKKVVYHGIGADGEAIRAHATYKTDGWEVCAFDENVSNGKGCRD
ncbi:MAG: porin, partial [Chlorobium phaeobacteroides]|nr:porin [Chlorobium phaeobacteroides]